MQLQWTLVLLLVLTVYLSWPPPPLPDAAISFRQRGNFFHFKSSSSGEFHRVFYIDTHGDGPQNRTAVLLHGFPMGSIDWSLMLPGLQELYSRIVIPEELGFGFSDKPAFYDYTMDGQAEIVEALLHHLGVDSAHVLSHDIGALVGQQMVVRFNERESRQSTSLRLQSFTSINGPLYLSLDNQLAVQYVIHLPVIGYALSLFGFEGLYQFNLRAMFGEKNVDEATRNLSYAMLRHKDGHLAQSKIFHYMKEREWYEAAWIAALNSTSIPVMYVFGPEDWFHVRAGFERYQREVPRAKVAELARGIGHTPLWEAPQAAVDVHRDFLDSVQ
eukprot:scpid56446/ scgid6370/ Mesoderm-specific transcript homolog protein; Paternally-expressed gene 1 protein